MAKTMIVQIEVTVTTKAEADAIRDKLKTALQGEPVTRFRAKIAESTKLTGNVG